MWDGYIETHPFFFLLKQEFRDLRSISPVFVFKQTHSARKMRKMNVKSREIINIASRICRTCFKQRKVIRCLTIKIDITKLVNEVTRIIGIFGIF